MFERSLLQQIECKALSSKQINGDSLSQMLHDKYMILYYCKFVHAWYWGLSVVCWK